jgi:hypothetical protein
MLDVKNLENNVKFQLSIYVGRNYRYRYFKKTYRYLAYFSFFRLQLGFFGKQTKIFFIL